MSSSSHRPLKKKRMLLDNLNLDAAKYKTDLEYERSLRMRDHRTAQAEQDRLQKLLDFAQSETTKYQTLLQEERQEFDATLDSLKESRDDAMAELRRLQQEQEYDDTTTNDGSSELWQRKCRLLEDQLSAKDRQVEQLQTDLETVRSDWKSSLQQPSEDDEGTTTPTKQATTPASTLSPAPSELLRELNRIRIELAESERSTRQWQRSAQRFEETAAKLVPAQETSRHAQLRVAQLEQQLKTIEKSYATEVAEHDEWKQFGTSLQAILLNDENDSSTEEVVDSNNSNNPHAMLRQVATMKQQLTQSRDTIKQMEERIQQFQNWKRPAQIRMEQYDAKEAAMVQQKKEWQHQVQLLHTQISTLQAQEAIWKREIKSLQELNASFDSLPQQQNANSKTAPLEMASLSSKLQAAQLELQARQDECHTIQTDRDRLQRTLDARAQETQDVASELTRVKEKYGKLREALELAKQAAQQADQRAVRAEELAGKGAFHPDHTRVLHLTQNPRTATLQKQNAALKQQLAQALNKDNNNAPSTTTTTTSIDPDKLHQRLKQQFRDQIALFREGVHLITGYKIDMIPDTQKHTFRIRSMFAAHKTDELLFDWPKQQDDTTHNNKTATAVPALHLMANDYAKQLAREPSYEYIAKYGSMPAFVASVQLSEFEKQTLMG